MGTIQARGTTGRTGQGTPEIEVLYFTDPYCSWCWAAEPNILRMKEEYGDQILFRTIMGGLVESAADAFDPGGERMRWLREHFEEVSARSGQPIDPAFLDAVDAQFSTWPACIHVSSAYLQTQDAGDRVLRAMRVGIMTQGKQPSDPDQARKMARRVEGLDVMAWKNSLVDGSALSQFLDDRRQCQEHHVHGFPAMLIRSTEEGRKPALITGYKPYEEMEQELHQVAPWLMPRPPRPTVDLLFDHGPLTTREIQEIQGLTPRETLDLLDGLAQEGTVETIHVQGGRLWALAEDVSDEEE